MALHQRLAWPGDGRERVADRRPGGSRKETRKRTKPARTRARGTAVGDGPVNGIVHPPAALLDAQATPLRLGEQATLRGVLGHVLRQNHVTASARKRAQRRAARRSGQGSLLTGTRSRHRSTSPNTRSPATSSLRARVAGLCSCARRRWLRGQRARAHSAGWHVAPGHRGTQAQQAECTRSAARYTASERRWRRARAWTERLARGGRAGAGRGARGTRVPAGGSHWLWRRQSVECAALEKD